MDFISGYQEMLRRTSPEYNINKIVDALRTAPQGLQKIVRPELSGYKEMLRRTSPTTRAITNQGDIASKISEALFNATQGDAKKIVNKDALGKIYSNAKTMAQTMADNKVVDTISKVAKNSPWGKGWGLVTPLYMATKSIMNPQDTLGYQIGEAITRRLSGVDTTQQQEPAQVTPNQEEIVNYLARSAQPQVSQPRSMPIAPQTQSGGLDDIGKYILRETSTQPATQYTQDVQTQAVQQQPAQQQYNNEIAKALLSEYGKLLGESDKRKANALRAYALQQPIANFTDIMGRVGLAGWARALDNPKLADAYTGSEYTKRLDKELGANQAIANQLSDRINKMNELGGAMAVAQNIGADPAVAFANKDLLKILVDAEKNRLTYDRYIKKAEIDLEIANKRNELLKYGYDINQATKMAVADIMARAGMYGADTRMFGTYGMAGMGVPQEVINYMTGGRLPSQGGIQPTQQSGQVGVAPTTLQSAQEMIRRNYRQ